MIRILKIRVVSGWMRLTVLLLFSPAPSCPKSEVKTRKMPKKLWRRSRQHSWAVTHDRRIILLLSFLFFFKRKTKTQRWTRCSGWHYGTEGVDRQICSIIKKEYYLCCSCCGADASLGASLRIISVQTINICHADLFRAAVVTSIMTPPSFFFFFHIFQISTRKVKPSVVPRSTSSNVFIKNMSKREKCI